MNKITPRSLRDLHQTLPEGTECYLCNAVRNALANYRKRNALLYKNSIILNKDQALEALKNSLGRGLERFFIQDIALELSKAIKSKKTAVV